MCEYACASVPNHDADIGCELLVMAGGCMLYSMLDHILLFAPVRKVPSVSECVLRRAGPLHSLVDQQFGRRVRRLQPGVPSMEPDAPRYMHRHRKVVYGVRNRTCHLRLLHPITSTSSHLEIANEAIQQDRGVDYSTGSPVVRPPGPRQPTRTRSPSGNTADEV